MTKQEARKLWIEALESGKYKKGRNILYRWATQEYCCLGVVCEIFGHTKPIGTTLRGYEDVQQLLGLRTPTGSMEDGYSLVSLNDCPGMTFQAIADIIRSEPEGLFINE